MHHSTERVSSMKRLDRVKEKNYPPKEYARAGKATGLVSGDIMVEENDDSYLRLRNLSKEEPSEEEQEQEQEEAEAKKQEDKQKASEYQDKRDEFQMDIAPGRMKDTAKDRTGKNANVAGGSEERPDEQKQSEQMGAGAVGKRTELGTRQDEEFKKKQEEEHGDSSTGPDEQQKARGKEAAREKVGEVGK